MNIVFQHMQARRLNQFAHTARTAGARMLAALALLSLLTACLAPGAAQLNGEAEVADKKVPSLYFGDKPMSNSFELVDEVQKERGGTATIFVKSGNDFVRVATNVQKDDGTRAIGTILDPKGKAIAAISKGESFYGEVDILGKPYITGYEPIRSQHGEIIGIYYVGYLK